MAIHSPWMVIAPKPSTSHSSPHPTHNDPTRNAPTRNDPTRNDPIHSNPTHSDLTATTLSATTPSTTTPPTATSPTVTPPQPENRKACQCAPEDATGPVSMLCQPKSSGKASRCAIGTVQRVLRCSANFGLGPWEGGQARVGPMERWTGSGGPMGRWTGSGSVTLPTVTLPTVTPPQPENRKACQCAPGDATGPVSMLCQPKSSGKASPCAIEVVQRVLRCSANFGLGGVRDCWAAWECDCRAAWGMCLSGGGGMWLPVGGGA